MLKDTIMNIGTDVVRSAEQHSPEICLGLGLVSMVAGAVFACKGTIKAKESVDKAKEDFELIERTEEKGVTYDEDNNPEEYTHEEAVKDHMTVIQNTCIDLVKYYGPSILLGTIGIGLILKGHNILRKRNFALVAAYEGISKAYKLYRNKVKDIIGEEAERELRFDVTEQEVDVETGKKNKDGTPKTKKEKIKVVGDPNAISPYARIFDSCCPSWENDPQFNHTILVGRQNHWNDLLKTRLNHTVFLNEVYADLGFPTTAAGQVVGWSLNHDSGDGYIDFGMYNMDYEPNRDFINGWEPCCLLNFNVDDTPVIDCLPKFGTKGGDNESV